MGSTSHALRSMKAVVSPSSSAKGWLAAAFRFGIDTIVALLLAAPWIEPRLVLYGWIGVAVLLQRATCRTAARRCASIGYSVSVAIVIAFYWAPGALANQMHRGYIAGLLAFLPLLALDAMRAALPFWIAARWGKHRTAAWFPAGLCAVVSEALFPSVFPWRFGYMQLAWSWTIQAADLFGSSWVSFMLFAHAGALLYVWEFIERRWLPVRSVPDDPPSALGVAAVLLCLANALYGVFAIQHWKQVAGNAAPLRVALLQVEPGYVQTVPTLRKLSEQVAGKVDLVCWPESSAGCYATDLKSLADQQQVFLQSREPDRGLQPWPHPHCALLTGASLYQGDGETPEFHYQGALLVDDREQIVSSYRKRFLMPFGEFMPLEEWFPSLQQLFPREEVISRGTQASVLPLGKQARLGVMLCYEDMMPQAARSLCQESANLLVSLINASDFKAPLARSQHRLLAQMRAVECRRYLARCAATGETCVINPSGEIDEQLPLKGEGSAIATVRLLEQTSVYSQAGEFLPWLCGAGLLAYLISAKWKTRKRRTAA